MSEKVEPDGSPAESSAACTAVSKALAVAAFVCETLLKNFTASDTKSKTSPSDLSMSGILVCMIDSPVQDWIMFRMD